MKNSNEHLLNHSELYILVYNGNTTGALALFREQHKQFEHESVQHIRLSLSALNHGIYNYILLQEQVSLHECCIQNAGKILTCTTRNSLHIGEQILTSYATCRDYLIEKHDNEHIKKALTYIHAHLQEDLTLRSVCDAINLNYCYLCGLFKREVRMRFHDYVLRQRISLAKQLLQITDLPIHCIALRCGFHTSAYFSTCFKKIEGVTPSRQKRG